MTCLLGEGVVGALAVAVHPLLHVGGEVLEDQVEHGLAGLLDVLDGQQLDHMVGLGQHLQQGHLAQGGRGHALLLHL